MKIDLSNDEVKMLKDILTEISEDVEDGFFIDVDAKKTRNVFDSLHKKVNDFVRSLYE